MPKAKLATGSPVHDLNKDLYLIRGHASIARNLGHKTQRKQKKEETEIKKQKPI